MLNDYVRFTKIVCEKKGWVEVPRDALWMLLVEEVGELASAVRRSANKFKDRKKISVESEIMDVLSYLLQLADMLDVDLDKEMERNLKQCLVDR